MNKKLNFSKTLKQNLHKRTKIISTIGPSSYPLLKDLLKEGVNLVRLNFSHGSHESHAKIIKEVKKLEKELGLNIAIIQDLPGPKHRIGKFKNNVIELKKGKTFCLCTEKILGDENRVFANIENLPSKVKKDDEIFLSDGTMKLKVLEKDDRKIKCIVEAGGMLSSEKGINIPNLQCNEVALTSADLKHLEFGIKNNVDFIALSFVSSPSDILHVKEIIKKNKTDIKVIAKIERKAALENLDEIIKAADGIMVARGDLGIELPIEKVPMIQKEIIQKCNHLGKPVIVATQMLESMLNSPTPTRAEATDIANAILDGADALMLSEETAIGKYPQEVIVTMHKIILETEKKLPFRQILFQKAKDLEMDTSDAISYAACHTSFQIGAVAIVALTTSGSTAKSVAKYRPEVPIIAISTDEKIIKHLALSWGVYAFAIEEVSKLLKLFEASTKIAKDLDIAKKDDLLVITGGVPLGVEGSTNLLKVERCT